MHPLTAILALLSGIGFVSLIFWTAWGTPPER